MTDHKPGCPANGGYGHGKEDCICGADAKPVDVGEIVKWLQAPLICPFPFDALRLKAADALLALQAEVARLTQENARLKDGK